MRALPEVVDVVATTGVRGGTSSIYWSRPHCAHGTLRECRIYDTRKGRNLYLRVPGDSLPTAALPISLDGITSRKLGVSARVSVAVTAVYDTGSGMCESDGVAIEATAARIPDSNGEVAA
jgi:hypothetical protein